LSLELRLWRFMLGNGAARLAYYKLRVQQTPGAIKFSGPVDQVHEHLAGSPAQPVSGKVDGRKPRVDILGQRDVVKANQRNIVRNAQPFGMDGAHHAERYDITRRKDGGRARADLLQDVADRRRAALVGEVAGAHKLLTVGDAGGFKRLPVALQPVAARGVGKRRVGDAGDVPMPQIDQMLDRETGPLYIVHIHKRDVATGKLPHHHNRDVLLVDARQLLIVEARAGQDDAIRPTAADQITVGHTRLGRVEGFDQNVVAARLDRHNDALHHR